MDTSEAVGNGDREDTGGARRHSMNTCSFDTPDPDVVGNLSNEASVGTARTRGMLATPETLDMPRLARAVAIVEASTMQQC